MSDDVSGPDSSASAPVADVRSLAAAAGRSHGSIIVPDALSRPRGVLTPEASKNFRSMDPSAPQIHFTDRQRAEIEVTATPRTVQERQSFAQQAQQAGRGDGDPQSASKGRVLRGVATEALRTIFGDEASHDVGIGVRPPVPESEKPGTQYSFHVRGDGKFTAGVNLRF